MRIITGLARGRKLTFPENDRIRPTTSLVKESIFNIIQFDIEGRRVLDLFAGTGQLGLESLSRGAVSCDFVDASRDAVSLIKKNLSSTELAGGTVYTADAQTFLNTEKKYDLIFIDPPYDYTQINKTLETIEQVDILSINGIIVCETDINVILPELNAPYQKAKEYRYGKVKITLYQRG